MYAYGRGLWKQFVSTRIGREYLRWLKTREE
jgi:hypothetical protein